MMWAEGHVKAAAPVSVSEPEERFRSAEHPTLSRHVQVIWLLARGHTTSAVIGDHEFRAALGRAAYGLL